MVQSMRSQIYLEQKKIASSDISTEILQALARLKAELESANGRCNACKSHMQEVEVRHHHRILKRNAATNLPAIFLGQVLIISIALI